MNFKDHLNELPEYETADEEWTDCLRAVKVRLEQDARVGWRSAWVEVPAEFAGRLFGWCDEEMIYCEQRTKEKFYLSWEEN